MGRTMCHAGNERISLFRGIVIEDIADGAGRTDFRAGSAETAVGIRQQFIVQSPDVYFHILLVIAQNAYLTKILAGTDTAAAEDTAEHLMLQQGILVRWDALYAHAHPCGRGIHILDQKLKLTAAELRTTGAFRRMGGKQQLHGKRTQRIDLLAPRTDIHTVLCFERTGRNRLRPVLFDQTEAAGGQIGEVRVMAQMRDIDSVLKCGFQDGSPFRNRDGFSVDLYCNQKKVLHFFISLFQTEMN